MSRVMQLKYRTIYIETVEEDVYISNEKILQDDPKITALLDRSERIVALRIYNPRSIDFQSEDYIRVFRVERIE